MSSVPARHSPRRYVIGALALGLFAAAVWFRFWPPEGPFYRQIEAACWKVGAVMAVWWLAYREVQRLPAWLVVAFPILLLILVVKAKLLLIAIPIVIALAILRPRGPRR